MSRAEILTTSNVDSLKGHKAWGCVIGGGVPMFPVKRRGAGVMALALGWGPGRAPGS